MEVRLIPRMASTVLLVMGALKSPIRLFTRLTVIPPETSIPLTVPVAFMDWRLPILFRVTDCVEPAAPVMDNPVTMPAVLDIPVMVFCEIVLLPEEEVKPVILPPAVMFVMTLPVIVPVLAKLLCKILTVPVPQVMLLNVLLVTVFGPPITPDPSEHLHPVMVEVPGKVMLEKLLPELVSATVMGETPKEV